MPLLFVALLAIPAGAVGVLAATDISTAPAIGLAVAALTTVGGVVTKLFLELGKMQTRLDEANKLMIQETMPVIGEAMAELRESRRERSEFRPLMEANTKALDANTRALQRARRS